MREENHQSQLAKAREIESQQITEMGVFRSVVENIVSMNCETGTKADILIEAVPDLGVIIAQLSLCKSQGLLVDNEYSDLVNECLLNLTQHQERVDFNPTYIGEFYHGE